jgi:hypothetical protein
MNSESGRSGRKDQGPQGTQVFSREEVSQLIDDAADEHASGSRAELTGLSSGVSGQSFSLGSTRIIVGRAENCDLRLEDSSVSSEHARIVRDSAGWRVVNLLSTNGTFVNDRKVSSSAIANGDRVRFGRVEFRFYDPDQSDGEKGKGGLPLWPIIFSVIGIAIIAVVVATIL